MAIEQKTTIWGGPHGMTLVVTLPGFPYGTPNMGSVVNIPGHGKAHCSGIQKTGTGVNELIMEVRFTLASPNR
jgi:hypothetical protein